MEVHKYQLRTPKEDVHLDRDVCRHTLHSLSWYPQTCQLLMSEAAPCLEISRERQEAIATKQAEQIFRVSNALNTIPPPIDSSDKRKADLRFSYLCPVSGYNFSFMSET